MIVRICDVSLDKKKLIQKTSDVLDVLDIPPHPFEDQSSKDRFFNRDGYSIGFRDHAVDTFEEAIKLISSSRDYKDISIKKIEDEYVQSLINLLLLYSKNTESTITEEINRCLKRLLESIEEHRVQIPIEFFKLVGIPELKIGNVRFIEFDLIKEKKRRELYEMVDNNQTIPPENKGLTKKHLEKIAIEPFVNKVCADIKVFSEVEKSYSKALYEVENAVNLLRCYIPLLFSRGLKVQIGIYGGHENISAGHRSLLSFKHSGGFNCRGERFGPLEPYNISPDNLKHLKDNYYLDQLGSILAKDAKSRSDLEKRIINAITWIGTGTHSGSDCNKLFMFVIALECLLIKRKEEGKSSPIAERCAFLLSDKPDRRIQIDKEVKDLYNTRSEIVHEGLTEITAEQAGSAQWLAISCLFKVCRMLGEWQNLDDLISWSKMQRYGANSSSIEAS
jgi:hypothetical protein